MSQQTGDWNTLVPVTGEAVALDLRLAQFPSRMLALFLDLLIQLVLLLVVVWLVSSTLSTADGAAAAAITITTVVLILVGWPTLIETLTRGRSLGKMAAGLRVVRDDGGPVRFRHSFVRSLFMIVDFWLTSGAVGLIASLASQRGKRVGDQFAGTVVIRERVPAAARVVQHAYAMPPGLEGWASTADLTRLPDVTAQQARQLLTRAATLEPTVRDSLGRQLAAEVQAYVAPPPPPGTHPEAYLAAVLTVRMRKSSAEAERARQQGALAMPAPMPAPTAAVPVPPSAPQQPLPPAAPDPDGFAPPA